MAPTFGWLKIFFKNSENQGFKFFKCSRDVKEHIFKEKNQKICFSWSVEILKVGVLQRASIDRGWCKKIKKNFSSSKTLGRHTPYSSFWNSQKKEIWCTLPYSIHSIYRAIQTEEKKYSTYRIMLLYTVQYTVANVEDFKMINRGIFNTGNEKFCIRVTTNR